MAKVQVPLCSLAASGTVAGALTFRRLGGVAVVQQPPVPAKPPTAAQQQCRLRAAWAADQWRAATPEVRQQWAALALRAALPPFGLFMREFITQRCTLSTTPQFPVYQP